jgi:hypothetical protein
MALLPPNFLPNFGKLSILQPLDFLYIENQVININISISNYLTRVKIAFQPTGSSQNSRFGRPPGRARVGPKRVDIWYNFKK